MENLANTILLQYLNNWNSVYCEQLGILVRKLNVGPIGGGDRRVRGPEGWDLQSEWNQWESACVLSGRVCLHQGRHQPSGLLLLWPWRHRLHLPGCHLSPLWTAVVFTIRLPSLTPPPPREPPRLEEEAVMILVKEPHLEVITSTDSRGISAGPCCVVRPSPSSQRTDWPCWTSQSTRARQTPPRSTWSSTG